MNLLHRYQFFARFFLLSYIINIFLIFLGLIAAFRFFQSQSLENSEMMFLGIGVFFFGFLFPLVAIGMLVHLSYKMKKQSELWISKFITRWMEHLEEWSKNQNAEPFKSPKFWVNVFLIFIEVTAERIQIPGVRILGEIAPLIRMEMKKADQPKGSE